MNENTSAPPRKRGNVRAWLEWHKARIAQSKTEIRKIRSAAELLRLSDGRHCIIDPERWQELSRHKWRVVNGSGYEYVRGQVGGHSILLHRYLTNAGPGDIVDHANGDTMDNRLCNLRICTNAQNIANSKKYRSGKTSQFKGVCAYGNRWRAQIMHRGQKKNLGLFSSEEEAAKAYDDAARERFGEFARLNFPRKVVAQ